MRRHRGCSIGAAGCRVEIPGPNPFPSCNDLPPWACLPADIQSLSVQQVQEDASWIGCALKPWYEAWQSRAAPQHKSFHTEHVHHAISAHAA